VARESGARRLVLFHHDPSHSDADLMAIERSASDYAAHIGVPEVVAGYDGLEIALSPALPKSG